MSVWNADVNARAVELGHRKVAPPMVATALSGSRRQPEEGDYVMSAKAVAAGIMDALEANECEVALGAAAGLRAQREALFSAVNS